MRCLMLSWEIVPWVATYPTLASVVVVLDSKTSAVEGVVVLILWCWKANSPHGSSRWRLHHASVLGAGRKVKEEVEKVEEEERKTFHHFPHHNVLIVKLFVRFREY